MTRRDGDPAGVWSFCLDPFAQDYDWRVKIGANKTYAERRVTLAREVAQTRKNLIEIRRIVDKIRSGS